MAFNQIWLYWFHQDFCNEKKRQRTTGLKELYAKVNCIMADYKDVSITKAKIMSDNSVSAEIEHKYCFTRIKERVGKNH